jgi:hypothetical protein
VNDKRPVFTGRDLIGGPTGGLRSLPDTPQVRDLIAAVEPNRFYVVHDVTTGNRRQIFFQPVGPAGIPGIVLVFERQEDGDLLTNLGPVQCDPAPFSGVLGMEDDARQLLAGITEDK